MPVFAEVQRLESQLDHQIRFAFRHFQAGWASPGVLSRIRRDVESGLASGEVLGTPTLFIDGVVHRGPYDAASLLEEVSVP